MTARWASPDSAIREMAVPDGRAARAGPLRALAPNWHGLAHPGRRFSALSPGHDPCEKQCPMALVRFQPLLFFAVLSMACGAKSGLSDPETAVALDAPDDAGVDAAVDPCVIEPTGSSNLPGVSIDVSGNRCSYTLAEVARGVEFQYRVVIEREVPDVAPWTNAEGCFQPGPSGLIVFARIMGSGQGYCDWCDTGLCGPHTYLGDLREGTYDGSLPWDGTNWDGPSDTLNERGPPFPPGRYSFSVRADGTAGGEDGLPFVVEGAFEFDLR